MDQVKLLQARKDTTPHTTHTISIQLNLNLIKLYIVSEGVLWRMDLEIRGSKKAVAHVQIAGANGRQILNF